MKNVPLCKESTTILDTYLLGFILLFTNPEGPVLTLRPLPVYGGTMVTKKALECKIETEEERFAALKEKNRRLKAEVRKLRKEKRSKGKPKGKLLSRQIVCHKY